MNEGSVLVHTYVIVCSVGDTLRSLLTYLMYRTAKTCDRRPTQVSGLGMN
jgi:membrane protein YqaA with SNARE-associated domain